MKITTDDMINAESITSQVPGTKGTKYETIEAWKGVEPA